MPVCGFNEKMIKGLEMFLQGLVEHGIQFRAKQNNETISQALKREIADTSRMLIEIQNIQDSGKRTLTEGLVKFALGFYLIIRQHKIQNYKQVINSINDYFHFMDEKYYSELENTPDDMESLAKLLNEKKI